MISILQMKKLRNRSVKSLPTFSIKKGWKRISNSGNLASMPIFFTTMLDLMQVIYEYISLISVIFSKFHLTFCMPVSHSPLDAQIQSQM